MTRKTRLLGKKLRLGERMWTGKGWRLVSPGKGRAFKASLLKKFTIAGETIAVFRVIIPE